MAILNAFAAQSLDATVTGTVAVVVRRIARPRWDD